MRGTRYPTIEHAFQACKTEDLAERAVIAALPTPVEARRAAGSRSPYARAGTT
ncbi:hypothetical protein [Deinococcus budaensis]|uniref:Putative NAD-dependent protein-ADP-ribosyltransferase YbiA (DUF1768 family) n=1 Tax=Deinococcus budaensis TaxID=1665626 RepID=A0A7W8LQ31_9DEIO|nr:hypothetical protein [Deinococcus budaensis]MBB5234217.1 putative NAD-dependent protein-ADP-ribosyltransferase YbiA (DUF1768 family) [Deinococcus budaensis]